MHLRHKLAPVVLALLATITAAEPENLGLLKARVREYMDSPAYFGEMEPAAKEAEALIRERAAHRAPGEKLAIVLDVDETTLSNYPLIRSRDFAYNAEQWDEWVRKAGCPAITPVLEIHRVAVESGVTTILLTGRREKWREATERNLAAVGYAGVGMVILKPDDAKEHTGGWKARERARLAAEGWTIIANIGDQESDLEGGNSGRVFKIPNPAYYVH